MHFRWKKLQLEEPGFKLGLSNSQTKPFNQWHRLSQHSAEKSGGPFFGVVSVKGKLGLRKKSRWKGHSINSVPQFTYYLGVQRYQSVCFCVFVCDRERVDEISQYKLASQVVIK